MSAREAKNPATQRFGKIDDLLNVNTDVENKDNINLDTNIDVNVEVKDDINDNVYNNKNDNKLAALKNKMKQSSKKESNKQVTVYLTPKNYKRFNALKEKGQKSELINQLLDLYFDE